MSNFITPRPAEDDILSQSSDEKMDTASESFRSQDTPNSTLSSDFDDKSETNVLTESLEDGVLSRLSAPQKKVTKTPSELTDSFVTNMANLNLDSPIENRTKNLQVAPNKNLGISPPKVNSNLVLTTSHPLMSSPNDFPDIIPKKLEERDFNLSSVEDFKAPEDGYGIYSPQMNNSKNNLYFSENFNATEGNVSNEVKVQNPPPPPDIVRRKIRPRFITPQKQNDCSSLRHSTPQCILGFIESVNRDESPIIKDSHEHNRNIDSSGSVSTNDPDIASRVAEWCETSHTRVAPKFDLPIELSTNVTTNNGVGSPDVVSSSTAEDKSAYEALLDPYTGSVALRPTATAIRSPDRRRRIQVPEELLSWTFQLKDLSSLDSLSVSMESEDEPPEPLPEPYTEGQEPVLKYLTFQPEDLSSLDSLSVSMKSEDEPPEPLPEPYTEGQESEQLSADLTPRSCSPTSRSSYSSPLPEYSAAEESQDRKDYRPVKTAHTNDTCDMRVIEPYKRVLSHGGYDSDGAAIIVFSACYLPDNGRTDYKYVMHNLFLYVIYTLERLVSSDYLLVYLHGSAGSRRQPSFMWVMEYYKLIDRRLRKSLKHLYLVHPTFWLKSFVVIAKPFVSSKFIRKLSYVSSLDELKNLVPVQPHAIPDAVRDFDRKRS